LWVGWCIGKVRGVESFIGQMSKWVKRVKNGFFLLKNVK